MSILKITGQSLFVLLIAYPAPTPARDYSPMYSPAELERANGIYSPNLEGILFEDIAQYLTDDELKTLHRIDLLQPGDRTNDPFEFAANSKSGVILVPTFSVKFFDDLSIAVAWFERHKCDTKAIFDYVTALDFSDMKLPAPLTALGVPQKAYKLDDFVDDVSQKILKSAVTFIVLHELGHAHLQHKPYSELSAEQAMAQETAADLFAMQVLRRMRLPPMGMTVWFMAVSMRDPLQQGSPRQTHPLSSSRLHAIAEDLRQNPEDFIEAANQKKFDADRIRQIAGQIDHIADGLSDPDLRLLLRQRGRSASYSSLAGGCVIR